MQPPPFAAASSGASALVATLRFNPVPDEDGITDIVGNAWHRGCLPALAGFVRTHGAPLAGVLFLVLAAAIGVAAFAPTGSVSSFALVTYSGSRCESCRLWARSW